MTTLFVLLIFLSFIGFIVGMVKPKLVIKWGADEKKNRRNVLKYYGLAFIISGVLIGVTAPPSESTDKTVVASSGQPTTLAQKNSANDDAAKKKAIEDAKKKAEDEAKKASEVKKQSDAAKDVNLLDYIGKQKTDIEKAFGKPKKIVDDPEDEEDGLTYYYDDYYFNMQDNKVCIITITNSNIEVNGTKVGMTTKNIRSTLGNPAKEENNDEFSMEYRINDNKISITYSCASFNSPVKDIRILDLMYGKETPMTVTLDKAKSLIDGTWVKQEYINNPDISKLTTLFENGVEGPFSMLPRHYKIMDFNIIVYTSRDSYDGLHKDEYTIEFYENGDRMKIFMKDNNGDTISDTDTTYLRYK
ncbi:MAG: hypothetical protein ACI8WT_004652 [Clostridium sp.]|jgi:hypothetical protein